MNLSKIKSAYLIGIKGAGMAAVAEILHLRGVNTNGSDTSEKFFTEEVLKKNKISFHEKFSKKNVPHNVDLVIYSTAYNEKNNEEFLEARKRNLKMLSYPEVLGLIFKEKTGIAVCGTHGKTTTTAMIAECLRYAGTDPSAIVGGKVINWQSSSLVGSGRYFVAEADEYQNKFAYYDPFAIVLTSIDWDHPDYFPTFSEYKKAFSDFIKRIPRHGFLVVWGDSANTLTISKHAGCDILTYGFSHDCDYKIYNHQLVVSGRSSNYSFQKFNIICKKKDLGTFQIKLFGRHNVLNASASVAVCHKLGVNMEKARESLANFRSTVRRFEYVGKRNGAILIDDYAHHPEEIKSTLKAAREVYPQKNIITVFHPHTFTRTKALLSEFSQSFDDTNKVIVMDIYGSAREAQGGVTSQELVNLINKYDSNKAEYVPTINDVVNYLKDRINKKDLVISMGAGDVWRVVDTLQRK